MSRKTKKAAALVSALLSAALLVPIFSGCSGGGDSSVTTTDGGASKNEPITVISDKQTDYSIVRSSDAGSGYSKLYTNFRADLHQATGKAPEFKDDKGEAAECEIVLGQTTRAISTAAYESLGDNQFGFFASGKTIAIAASDPECMNFALDKFIELFVADGNLVVDTSNFPRVFECKDEITTVSYSNTEGRPGNDPYIVEHDGYYYYCWSDAGVKVARFENLEDVSTSGGSQVFSAGTMYQAVWAPELHYVDGEWYIYVAMQYNSDNNADHRMYCLKGTSQDPTKPFELVGKVTDSTDKWAIDGTVFKYNGELYTVWSGWEGDVDVAQYLYIAHMSNPWTIDSERVLISKPDSWDYVTKSPSVNEGPCALNLEGKQYILFSGNGSWTDNYCIGYLVLEGDDPLDADSWVKSESAVLRQTIKCYGPGHCSVFKAADGSWWTAYHANLKPGQGWSGRSYRIQPLEVNGSELLVTKAKLTVEIPSSTKVFVGEIEK